MIDEVVIGERFRALAGELNDRQWRLWLLARRVRLAVAGSRRRRARPGSQCTGLAVYARLDDGSYPDKIRVSDREIQAVKVHGDPFHSEWNHTIKPKR